MASCSLVNRCSILSSFCIGRFYYYFHYLILQIVIFVNFYSVEGRIRNSALQAAIYFNKVSIYLYLFIYLFRHNFCHSNIESWF